MKRYNTFVSYFRERYGERLQKIVVDGGFTCPNRDGTLGRGGCTYCDNAAFHPAYSAAGKGLRLQIDEGIGFHRIRYRNARHFLAYFQPYSNTYAPLERLRELYEEALSHPDVVGIVIGTRPDCVDSEKLDYLAALKDGLILKGWERTVGGSKCNAEKGGGVPGDAEGGEKSGEISESKVWHAPLVTVEYGIESCYDETLRRINRCHGFGAAQWAVEETARRGIDCGAHFILGLPGETRQMMLDECAMINALPLLSVKFHQLQIVRGTAMEREYADRPHDFVRFGLDEYIDFFAQVLRRLRPDLYIDRFAGEVPPRFVSETPWGLLRNADLLNMLDARLEALDIRQGDLL